MLIVFCRTIIHGDRRRINCSWVVFWSARACRRFGTACSSSCYLSRCITFVAEIFGDAAKGACVGPHFRRSAKACARVCVCAVFEETLNDILVTEEGGQCERREFVVSHSIRIRSVAQ